MCFSSYLDRCQTSIFLKLCLFSGHVNYGHCGRYHYSRSRRLNFRSQYKWRRLKLFLLLISPLAIFGRVSNLRPLLDLISTWTAIRKSQIWTLERGNEIVESLSTSKITTEEDWYVNSSYSILQLHHESRK